MANAALKERINTTNTSIVLVDHQIGTIGWVYSLPRQTVINSTRVLARMAVTYGMPLFLTTTMEEYVGATMPELVAVAEDAFARRFKRGGELCAFDDATLSDAVKAAGRKKLVLAGLTTDICLFWAADAAVRQGYDVTVVADACGTMTALGDQTTFDRLRDMGVTVAGINQVVTELVNNFGTPEGQKAQQIMSDEIISKLGAA